MLSWGQIQIKYVYNIAYSICLRISISGVVRWGRENRWCHVRLSKHWSGVGDELVKFLYSFNRGKTDIMATESTGEYGKENLNKSIMSEIKQSLSNRST